MFASLLIANRGEIACRVIRTARRLGLRTIAVYSDADRDALHMRLADEAWPIGPARAAESYLDRRAVIDAVRRSGAEAVHPGYGFLAENAAFATAVKRAGAVFVGPPARAIRAMGSKSAAKALMEKAGVPIVPGYHDADQSLAAFRRAAAAIGYPLLVKASAGGGGRGMRLVERAEDLRAALESARREAASAFGDDRLLVEKFLDRPRHIEVQVFADNRGNTVHLFERDCSIQRRHQKVIEEAPAPGLADELRAALGTAAVAAARAVGYENAGTVEFLLDAGGNFYFMEMNTRIQVEHPVTEMIAGRDLVEWQLRVAAGEPLPCAQADLRIDGHAIEARLYAEDPARGFLPASGTLAHVRFPEAGAGLRVETAVGTGDTVSVHYDPMIAKLIAHGPDRAAAIRRLAAALAGCEVVGVATNLAFLAAVIGHADFAAGRLDTGFVARHGAALLVSPGPPPDEALALACVELLVRQAEQAATAARASADPHSPWHRTDGWRLGGEGRQSFRFLVGEDRVEIMVHYRRGGGWRLDLPGGAIEAHAARQVDGSLAFELDGVRRRGRVVAEGERLAVLYAGAQYRLTRDDPLARAAGLEPGAGHLTAPMPGRVLAVHVRAGERVAKGARLMVLEAMKMEHTIAAPADGLVERINYAAGDQVEEGVDLIVMAAAEPG